MKSYIWLLLNRLLVSTVGRAPVCWTEGTGEGCGFLRSLKLPYLSTNLNNFVADCRSALITVFKQLGLELELTGNKLVHLIIMFPFPFTGPWAVFFTSHISSSLQICSCHSSYLVLPRSIFHHRHSKTGIKKTALKILIYG